MCKKTPCVFGKKKIYIYTYIYIYIYIYMCVCMRICRGVEYTHMHIYIYIYVCVCEKLQEELVSLSPTRFPMPAGDEPAGMMASETSSARFEDRDRIFNSAKE